MNESPYGPFRSLSVLWFPFAMPAVVIGMLAWTAFYLVNLLLAAVFEEPRSAWEAIGMFGGNLRSSILGLRLDAAAGGLPLFASQLAASLLIWSTLGLAIARVQAVRLARDEYVGYRAALAFGFRHAPTAMLYPAILIVIVATMFGLQVLLGALVQIPWLGLVFALLLPFAYLLTAAAVAVTLSGIFGLGMVSGAIAVEKKGTLDAWGKSLNYLFARPLHVVVYAVLVKVVLVDVVLHYAFEEDLLHRWTESLLSLAPVDPEGWARSTVGGPDASFRDLALHWLRRAVAALADVAVIGAVISAFFAAFTGMFLIFRRDVDGIDVGDIELEEELEDLDPEPAPVAPLGSGDESDPA